MCASGSSALGFLGQQKSHWVRVCALAFELLLHVNMIQHLVRACATSPVFFPKLICLMRGLDLSDAPSPLPASVLDCYLQYLVILHSKTLCKIYILINLLHSSRERHHFLPQRPLGVSWSLLAPWSSRGRFLPKCFFGTNRVQNRAFDASPG